MFPWYWPQATAAAMSASALASSTAMAASITIAHRMTMMMTPYPFQPPGGQDEAMRMVAEKFDAAHEGSRAAAMETGRFMVRSAFGQVSPDDVARGMIAIGVAAAKPAARKAKANAKRLSGARPGRRKGKG